MVNSHLFLYPSITGDSCCKNLIKIGDFDIYDNNNRKMWMFLDLNCNFNSNNFLSCLHVIILLLINMTFIVRILAEYPMLISFCWSNHRPPSGLYSDISYICKPAFIYLYSYRFSLSNQDFCILFSSAI